MKNFLTLLGYFMPSFMGTFLIALFGMSKFIDGNAGLQSTLMQKQAGLAGISLRIPVVWAVALLGTMWQWLYGYEGWFIFVWMVPLGFVLPSSGSNNASKTTAAKLN